MQFKRITLLCGHYGSGKTNVALNMAYELKQSYSNVAIADLDIVNPYFRTKDSAKDLEEKGIKTSIPVTDDAMVVEYFLNQKVHLVYGSYENIKITTPEDMRIAEAFLQK